jgi:hypothetical protein
MKRQKLFLHRRELRQLVPARMIEVAGGARSMAQVCSHTCFTCVLNICQSVEHCSNYCE